MTFDLSSMMDTPLAPWTVILQAMLALAVARVAPRLWHHRHIGLQAIGLLATLVMVVAVPGWAFVVPNWGVSHPDGIGAYSSETIRFGYLALAVIFFAILGSGFLREKRKASSAS